MLTFLLGVTRVWFSMSRDGLLPTWFAKVDRHGTPQRVTWIAGVGSAVLAGVFPIREVADLTNIGILSAFIVVCVGRHPLPLHPPRHPPVPSDCHGCPWCRPSESSRRCSSSCSCPGRPGCGSRLARHRARHLLRVRTQALPAQPRQPTPPERANPADQAVEPHSQSQTVAKWSDSGQILWTSELLNQSTAARVAPATKPRRAAPARSAFGDTRRMGPTLVGRVEELAVLLDACHGGPGQVTGHFADGLRRQRQDDAARRADTACDGRWCSGRVRARGARWGSVSPGGRGVGSCRAGCARRRRASVPVPLTCSAVFAGLTPHRRRGGCAHRLTSGDVDLRLTLSTDGHPVAERDFACPIGALVPLRTRWPWRPRRRPDLTIRTSTGGETASRGR